MLPYITDRIKTIIALEDPRPALIAWYRNRTLVINRHLKAYEQPPTTFTPEDCESVAFLAANEMLELHQMLPELIKQLRCTGFGGVYQKPTGPNHKMRKT